MVDSPSPRSGQMLDPDQAPGKEQPVGTRAPVLGTALPLAATPGQAPSPSVPANPPRTPEQPKDQPRDPLKEPQPDPFSELSALYGLTERLTASSTLEDTLRDVLEAGATLVGAQRGMVLLTESSDGRPPAFGTVRAPGTIVGLGFDHSALGALETVPRDSAMYAGLLNGCSQVLNPGPLNADPLNAGPPSAGPSNAAPSNAAPSNVGDGGTAVPGPGRPLDAVDPDARFHEVARCLGFGASFALPLTVPGEGTAPFGVAVWFYDRPTAPAERQQRLAGLYCAAASRLIALEVKRERLRRTADTLRRGLLPDRLPRLPRVQLAARCLPAGLDGSHGSDWYDALQLPDGCLALSVGSVTGGGADCAAAMGRLRAALRAYAVLEGEDPVAVLGDLELLLKATEPARTATALYAYLDPATRRLSLAGAGHCPPLLVSSFGASFVETSLSAPLGMLSCWEAPSVELRADRGDLLLLYTEGLARRCGPSLHAGQLRLRSAAASAPRDVRHDLEHFCSYLLDACESERDSDRVGDRDGSRPAPEADTREDDIVLLAARFV